MKKLKALTLLACLAFVGTLLLTPIVKNHTGTSETRAKRIVKKMSLDEKIGQILMTDFRQWKSYAKDKEENLTEANKEVSEIINKYHLGGVILFANNVKDTEQTTKLTYDLQKAAMDGANKNLPLLLSIDQEGGIVTRLLTGTCLPGNMAIGATRSEEDSYSCGDIIGKELSALGINVNLAPCLDINNNPNNPVIGLRSFSSKADLTSELGLKYIDGLQCDNVASAAKHFPGHGDTETDSHVGLPLVNKSLDELRALELIPFKAAADAKVDMLMTAHIQYPQIETGKFISKKDGKEINIPATLSKTIIDGIARKELGYNGVIITDALNMAAISENFGEVEAVKMAINAGVDIALMPTTLKSEADIYKLEAIIDGLKKAVKCKEISIDRINEAATRVVKLKIDRGIINYSQDKRTLEERIINAKAVVGSIENRDKEREIAADSITVLNNYNNALPLIPKENSTILVITPYENQITSLKYGINRLITEGKIKKVNIDAICYKDIYNLNSDMKVKINTADSIIMLTQMTSKVDINIWPYSMPRQIIDFAKTNKKNLVVCSVGKPYDAVLYKDAKALICAYGYIGMQECGQGKYPTEAFGPNIPAICDIIFAAREPKGKLPLDLPAYDEKLGKFDLCKIEYRFGDGITDLSEKHGQDDPIETSDDIEYYIVLVCLIILAIVIIGGSIRETKNK